MEVFVQASPCLCVYPKGIPINAKKKKNFWLKDVVYKM